MNEQLIQVPCVFGENGNFLLERELGSGGMGGVYMGRDKQLDRPVAVKVMLRELGSDPEFVEKFKREAQAAARLVHPNIAQVYSYGICDGMPYMAMELAPGGSLFSLMSATPGTTDVSRVIKICQQVAQALQCASDQGLVHGDIKPENILLDANGNAKLVDFGLAGMQKDTDEIWGTPYYIAPEKVEREAVDFRADMYSLGGTLYHALTGVAPFEADDSNAVVRKRFEEEPKKPSQIRPDLTPEIDELVMTMLAFRKEDRYPSFEALLEAFKSVLSIGLTTNLSAAATRIRGTRRMSAARGRLAARSRAAYSSSAVSQGPDEAEPAEGGNLAIKVVASIVGVVLLIAFVIGGLYWLQVSDKKSRESSQQTQISIGVQKAFDSISETMKRATQFAAERDLDAKNAVSECQKASDELAKLIPAEQRPFIKPAPTKELLDEIASTNKVAETNGEGSEAKNAKPEARAVSVVRQPELPKFREPTEDEKDPASPEGEAYAAAKKAFLEEQRAKQKSGAWQESSTEEETKVKLLPVVEDMNALWVRAYSCQACAVRIRKSVQALLEKGASASTMKVLTKEDLSRLQALSGSLVDMYERIKGSSDVDNVRKGVGILKSKSEKLIKQTIKQLKIDKMKAEREAQAKKQAEDEAAEKKRKEEEHKATIARETAQTQEKFDDIVTKGLVRQLDWKSALRLLQAFGEELTTTEGKLALDRQIEKINDMKLVHDIFIKGMNGYVFKNSKLRLAKIEKINEKEFVISRPKSENKTKITWQKFYKEYPGNLNEVMNGLVVNVRKQTTGLTDLSKREWADAMIGAALTMRLVCAEVNGALERADVLARTVVEEYPEYLNVVKSVFPDLSLEAPQDEE